MAEQSGLTVITKVRGAGLMIPPGMKLCPACEGIQLNSSRPCVACRGAGFVAKEN